MSGGDVGPLGTDAVTALHGLFRWAAKSPRSGLYCALHRATPTASGVMSNSVMVPQAGIRHV